MSRLQQSGTQPAIPPFEHSRASRESFSGNRMSSLWSNVYDTLVSVRAPPPPAVAPPENDCSSGFQQSAIYTARIPLSSRRHWPGDLQHRVAPAETKVSANTFVQYIRLHARDVIAPAIVLAVMARWNDD